MRRVIKGYWKESHYITSNVTGSWSKWGGANQGMIKEDLPEWSCQSCADTQRRGMPSYMVEVSSLDYVRICSRCKNIMVREGLNNYWSLIAKVRPSSLQT
jgi:hypothetical protein